MKAKIYVIIFVIGVLVLQTLAIIKVANDNHRLSDNLKSVLTGTEYYQLNDSIHAARNERILLNNEEIKRFFPEVTRSINRLDVKMRQLERYSAVGTTANYNMAIRLHDTAQIKETVIQERIVRDTLKMQYIRYKDKWLDFQQAIVADSAYTAIQTRDSIAIVQSWERAHRFWFIKYGRKRHTQTVTNANPHSKITYSIYVEKN